MWNYRVIAHDDHDEVCLELCEVYYDKDNIPNGYIENKSVNSDSVKGCNWHLNKMKLALKKPILSKKNFPNEYKP